MIGAGHPVDLDAVLPLVVEDRRVADPVVRTLLESGDRQRVGIEQRTTLRADAALWNDIARERLASQRVDDVAKPAESPLPLRRGWHDRRLFLDGAVTLPLLSPEEEQILLAAR